MFEPESYSYITSGETREPLVFDHMTRQGVTAAHPRTLPQHGFPTDLTTGPAFYALQECGYRIR